MRPIPFNDSWTCGPKVGQFEGEVLGATDPAVSVILPHDAIRDLPRAEQHGVHTGFFPGGVFEYKKKFDVPKEWVEKTVVIEFEGVYRDAMVYVNGEFAFHQANGYAPFSVKLDPYLVFGKENTLSVVAKSHRDSRWYTGCGIYRPVHLSIGDPVHIPLNGTRITTSDIDEDRAIVAITTKVVNETRHTRQLRLAWSIRDGQGAVVASGNAPLTVLPQEEAVGYARIPVESAHLWSVDHPSLYTLQSSLSDIDAPSVIIDSDETTFGIRKLQVDPKRGLRINGETVKLRGACIHHDNGPLGAAGIVRAEERKVQLLKAAGFNSIRSAHNPISRALLDACDRNGVVVMDELTDTWTKPKIAFDRSSNFVDDWRRDVESWVTTGYNHPSVIMYSIGNEILEVATPIGSTWSRKIANYVRELDPTRFVTNGINGVISNQEAVMASLTPEAAAKFADPNAMMAQMGELMDTWNASDLVTNSVEESAAALDIVGFNYAQSRYASDIKAFPNRVIVGSETFPDQIDVMWDWVKRLPHVIGDFTWTGWDYLGEAGLGRVDYPDSPDYKPTAMASGYYPFVTAGCGDIDITGFRHPISYYREIVFGLRSDPFIAVYRPSKHGKQTRTTPWSWNDSVSSWSWSVEDGAPVKIDVYADAEEVELVLNGESVGVQRVGESKAFIATFETRFHRGELVAIARRDGQVVGKHLLRSAEKARLVVRSDRDVVNADPSDLAYVAVTIEDETGVTVMDSDLEVSVEVSGAELLGLASGNPRTEGPFGGLTHKTNDGRLLAVVRPTTAGQIVVTASADGHQSARATITAVS